jgi:pyruvate kinase
LPVSSTRRTKIVATLGPSWGTPEAMTKLLDAGVNVVRINASHGTPEIRDQWVGQLNELIGARSEPAAILIDLPGPRIRVGTLAAPLPLEVDQEVVFAPEGEAGKGEIPTTYAALADDLDSGGTILLDDGLLAVAVSGVDGNRVRGTVLYGGLLRSNKGINLPGIDVSAPALTQVDREEVARVIHLGVDFIGLSFVQHAEDLVELRTLVPKTVRLVAKIEKDTAVENCGSIIDAADAVMVARGDLGVELPFERVPLVQKELIREAMMRGKPVITATQMLESMVQAPRPTRAETSDVANAILDGTDAVMLSAETAIGKYPVKAVRAMARIAREVEGHRRGRSPAFDLAVGRRTDETERLRANHDRDRQPTGTEDAIAVAVSAAVDLMMAPLIVCFTSSGFTARTVAAYRPSVPIVALTPERETYRRLSLVWGVVPMLVDHQPNYDSMWRVARQRILASTLARPDDRVVVTAGIPFDTPGTTNLLKVEVV